MPYPQRTFPRAGFTLAAAVNLPLALEVFSFDHKIVFSLLN
jgi:hypothetical protein